MKKLHVNVQPPSKRTEEMASLETTPVETHVRQSRTPAPMVHPSFRSEVGVGELKPMPVARALQDLKGTNERLNTTLGQISTHLETVTKRDQKIIESLGNIDATIATTSAALDSRLQLSDKALTEVGAHIESSSRAFGDIISRLEQTERESREALTTLQKRSNIIQISLGVAFVVTAIVLFVLSR